MTVTLARLDTAAMAADPDGAGELTSGYDDDFREPVAVAQSASDTTGTTVRVETEVQFPAQIEPQSFDNLQQLFSGAHSGALVELIAHFRDLERLGLVDAVTGLPLINHNDRLSAIYNPDGELIQTIPNPPGLYCVQVQPRGFGFGRQRNLLLLSFEAREQGVLTGA